MEPKKKLVTRTNKESDDSNTNSPPEMKAQAEAMGLNWDDVKKGLVRFLPMMEMLAKLTSTPYDDAAVEFLKKLVGSSTTV